MTAEVPAISAEQRNAFYRYLCVHLEGFEDLHMAVEVKDFGLY